MNIEGTIIEISKEIEGWSETKGRPWYRQWFVCEFMDEIGYKRVKIDILDRKGLPSGFVLELDRVYNVSFFLSGRKHKDLWYNDAILTSIYSA